MLLFRMENLIFFSSFAGLFLISNVKETFACDIAHFLSTTFPLNYAMQHKKVSIFPSFLYFLFTTKDENGLCFIFLLFFHFFLFLIRISTSVRHVYPKRMRKATKKKKYFLISIIYRNWQASLLPNEPFTFWWSAINMRITKGIHSLLWLECVLYASRDCFSKFMFEKYLIVSFLH